MLATESRGQSAVGVDQVSARIEAPRSPVSSWWRREGGAAQGSIQEILFQQLEPLRTSGQIFFW